MGVSGFLFGCVFAFCLGEGANSLQKVNVNLQESASVWYGSGNDSFIFMLSSDNEIAIRESRNDSNVNDMCGTTPDIPRYGRSGGAPVNFTFTALTDTNFTMTYGDISSFRCDSVILDDRNPFLWAITKLDSGRTCVIVAMNGEQTIIGTMEKCEICPVVDVYAGSSARIVRLTGPSSFDGKSNETDPIVVVISPADDREPDFEGFHFTVTSSLDPYVIQSHIEWNSAWAANPPEPKIIVRDIGNICTISGIGVMGFLVVLMSARILYKELTKKKQKSVVLSLGSQLMFSKSVQYDG
jgi:hypothetical protein